jgi:hypothetical protein
MSTCEMIRTMNTFSVTEISRIAKAAARRASPQLDVIGVTINAGGSDYVEIVVDIRGCHRESCQVVLGVFRKGPEAAIDRAITEQLRRHVAAHQPDQSHSGDRTQPAD